MGVMDTGGERRERRERRERGERWERWDQAARRAAAYPRAPVVAAVVLALEAVVQAAAQVPRSGPAGAGIGAGGVIAVVVLAAAGTLPLGLLWAQPRVLAVLLAVTAVVSVALARDFTAGALVAVLISLALLGARRAQLPAGLICAVFLLLALLEAGRQGAPETAVLLAGAAPLAAWAGYARRVRDETAAQTAERAAIEGSLLEHSARGERARISRELHDVVAHHISMISVQAETARLTTPGLPAAGAQRLSAIGDTARAALTEMRRLLGVLREDTGDEPAQRQPQPGLSQLALLLDEARDASGTGIRLIISGWVAPLDPGVELAGYRIIQEALTNARRHAPGAAVDVELRYLGGQLHLRVRDNGPGPPPGQPGGGHGLTGMAERAAAVGGRLRTDYAPGGGFLVEAWLPATAEEAVA
jgi:signal transduction histidine kinase